MLFWNSHVIVKIRDTHGQMNIVIHKFWNFKIKFKKNLDKIVSKVYEISNFIIIILFMAERYYNITFQSLIPFASQKNKIK